MIISIERKFTYGKITNLFFDNVKYISHFFAAVS